MYGLNPRQTREVILEIITLYYGFGVRKEWRGAQRTKWTDAETNYFNCK